MCATSPSILRAQSQITSATCSTWATPLLLGPRDTCGKQRRYKPLRIVYDSQTRFHKCSWPLPAVPSAGYGDWGNEPEAAASFADSRPAKGASMPATVFNLVNVIMGAGYVSIPFACKQGGWAALAVLWLLGAVFCYTGHALLQCCRLVGQRKAVATVTPQQSVSSSTDMSEQHQHLQQQQRWHASYEAVAGYAFGPLGLTLVSSLMYAELLGICCVYVVLEAETLSTLLSSTAFGHSLIQWLGPSAFGLFASAVMVPTVLLPDLESLSVLGAMGVAAAAAVGLVLAGLFVTSGSTALSTLAHTSVVKLQTLPQVLGILAFVYAGHSTFPVIQQSMAQPADGPRAVRYGYAVTALICTVLGGFGYALYGPQTQPVITASLPAMSMIALVCTALTLCNPFSAFALTLEPVAVAAQKTLVRMRQGSSSSPAGHQARQDNSVEVPYIIRAVIRLGLALACCATALVLPYVAEVMAFVGALLTMSISLIIPAVMHITLLGRELPWWVLLFDGCVLLLGTACAAIGATSAWECLQGKLASAAVAQAVVARPCC